jgi:hypothetical protein
MPMTDHAVSPIVAPAPAPAASSSQLGQLLDEALGSGDPGLDHVRR